MEEARPPEQEASLVRCLDCGTAYELLLGEEGAGPCPECGEVGWVALDGALVRRSETQS